MFHCYLIYLFIYLPSLGDSLGWKDVLFCVVENNIQWYVCIICSDKCLHPPCQILSSFPELRSKPVSPENFLYTSEVCNFCIGISRVNHLVDIMLILLHMVFVILKTQDGLF